MVGKGCKCTFVFDTTTTLTSSSSFPTMMTLDVVDITTGDASIGVNEIVIENSGADPPLVIVGIGRLQTGGLALRGATA